ncbi:hypothetical protein ABIB25_004439 [Nakamurella sp. UYEF19]|uniref:hypothetical protein n=1 Tax=Nakamurella sp. UYEF19 TaxID=1756392 RepID=UPI00339307AC
MVQTRTARRAPQRGAPLRWGTLVVAAGLMLSACSGQAGFAGTVDGARAGASNGVTTTDVGSATDASRTLAFDMSIRVANTYVTPKTAVPTAVEVWVGAPGAGKKLATVPYAQVSNFFAPEMLDPFGQGIGDGQQRFTVTYYAAGATAASRPIGDESEPVSTGLKLTLVVAPTDPTNADPDQLGAASQLFADALGSGPNNAFKSATLPKPPAGHAVLLLNALALQGRKGMTQGSGGLTPSTTDGKCLPYFEFDSAGLGYSGDLHDMTSDVFQPFGGTSNLVYPVEPGTQVRINQLGTDERVSDTCAKKPVLAAFDPKLTAGQGAYGLMYGPDLAHARILVIPAG